MQLNFHITYHTKWGEYVVLKLWNNHTEKPALLHKYKLETHNGYQWFASIEMFENLNSEYLTYEYVIEENNIEKRIEWQMQKHVLYINCLQATQYNIFDQWNAMPCDTYLYSSAFTACIQRRTKLRFMPSSFASTLRICVRAPQLGSNQALALVGNCAELGEWQTQKALPMTETQTNEWAIDLEASSLANKEIAFKFVAFNTEKVNQVLWETNDNRIIKVPIIATHSVHCVTEEQAFFDICDVKVAGTAVPLFSLRSHKSFGVGDFGDLKLMIDFIYSSGQKVLQLLPINDTTATHTWKDCYPYSCVSVFALHPQYICLHSLPPLVDKAKQKHFSLLQKTLNQLPEVDYEQVNQAKNAYLKELYNQNGVEVLSSASFTHFFETNQHWLFPYAQYCALRDLNGTCNFDQWKDHERWDERERVALANPQSPQYKAVAFYYYVQYLLFSQMQDVHTYAQQKQVVLKGDIPIGVAPHGCDVWTEPKYFNRDAQAGAPPDDFAVNGQNWGFPTYNWNEMLKDNCAWWNKRFVHMSNFFDAYRIDHVLGFFRIWDIPITSIDALLGQFSPALGLTKSELEQAGFVLNEPLHTTPCVTINELNALFGESVEEVKQRFLMPINTQHYTLKASYNTQRKIEKAFENATTAQHKATKQSLFALLNNVLFVKDKKQTNLYHPRIVGDKTLAYAKLNEQSKQAFLQVHNDYFYHRNEEYWKREAFKKLPLLVQSTKMLVCAEDLGMVPACVKDVMEELRMFSLEIEAMPKAYNVRFGDVNTYPYRSVCTISTHDMATLRLWWDENYEQTQHYYNHVLKQEGIAPHPLTPQVAQMVIQNHLNAPSCLCILSVQDWLSVSPTLRRKYAEEERINIPANPNHYWKYRLHLNIEDLLKDKNYINKVKEMIVQGKRNK